MSQRSVEVIIGRLATDEGFLRRFEAEREVLLEEVAREGHPLTPCEHRALLALDLAAAKRFAEEMDPRLRKVCLRKDRG